MKKSPIFLILFLFSFVALAQESTDDVYNIPTPNACSMRLYGNVSMSEYTGKADISNPIYSSSQRGVPLDIFLSYDTSGILVNNLPGWTGHGWTLIAGGCITRQKVLYSDELCWPNQVATQHNNLYSFTETGSQNKMCAMIQHAPDIFVFNFMGKSGRFALGNDGEWKVMCDENIDVIHEICSDGSNLLAPFIPLQPNDNEYPKTIKEFVLIDGNGNRYIFGGTTDAIEYSINLFSTGNNEDHDFWTADTWMLSEVQDRFGLSLYKFDYSRGKFIVQINNTNREIDAADVQPGATNFPYKAILNAPVFLDKITERDGNKIIFKRTSAFPKAQASRVLYPSYYMHESDLFTQHISFLKKQSPIPFYHLQGSNNELMKYQANNDSDKMKDPLASMDLSLLWSIETSNNGLYSFQYGYNGRIHLTQVSHAVHGTYKLEYNSFEELTPDYLSSEKDLWGYYNGKQLNSYGKDSPQSTSTNSQCLFLLSPDASDDEVKSALFAYNNKTLNKPTPTQENTQENKIKPLYEMKICPDYDVVTYVPNSDYSINIERRKTDGAPVFEKACLGMLKRIIYPTNGYTEFEYEQNTYTKSLTGQYITKTNELCGGLRLSKIKNYDNIEDKTPIDSTTYQYSDGETYVYPQSYCIWNYQKFGKIETIVPTRKKKVDDLPCIDYMGPHIGYSHVIETKSDGTSHEMNFINMSTLVQYSIHDFYAYAYMLGKKISESFYDTNKLLVREIIYDYDYGNKYNDSHYITTNNGLLDPSGTMYWWPNDSTYANNRNNEFYRMYFPRVNLLSKTVIDYYGRVKSVTKNKYGFKAYELSNTYPYTHKSMFWTCEKEQIERGEQSYLKEYSNILDTLGNESELYCRGYDVPDDYIQDSSTYVIPYYFIPSTKCVQKENNVLVDYTRTVYDSHLLPKFDISYGLHTNDTCLHPDTIMQYSYNPNTYLLDSYTNRSGIKVKLIWDEKERLVGKCMNVEGNVRYDQSSLTPWPVISDVNELWTDKPTNITACRYDNHNLIKTVTSGNCQTRNYEYKYGKLVGIRNENGILLNRFKYKIQTGIELPKLEMKVIVNNNNSSISE